MSYIKMNRAGGRRSNRSFLSGAEMRFDEGVLGEGAAFRCENFRFSDGALTDGYGLDAAPEYEGLSLWSVWDFPRYDFAAEQYAVIAMLCDTDGVVRARREGGGWEKITGAVFTSPPRALVYRLYGEDTVIMTSDTDGMVVWDGVSEARRIEDSPMITSFAMHFERLYATTAGEQNAVYFSDDLDPTNWNQTLSEGGYIQLLDERGKLLRVVDFLNYVYVFREFGISRLTAYGDQREFSATNLYVSSGKIYGDSVAATGGRVLFLSGDGLCSFDGYGISHKLQNIAFDDSPHAFALASGNKYYLAARVKNMGGEEKTNNALLVYSLSDGSYALSRLNVSRLVGANEAVYALDDDGTVGKVCENGRFFDAPLEKIWESGFSDFGNPRIKTLKEVTLRSDKAGRLTITCDGGSHDYEFDGGGLCRIKPTLASRRFRLKITSKECGTRIVRLSYVLE